MNKKVDTFANRLNTAMIKRNIKAVELSEKTGIAKSSISEYLKGKYEAKQDSVYLLAKVLNVSETWLLGIDVPMQKNNHTNSKQALPLLGTVKAGYDYIASENIIGYVSVDSDIKDIENCFALKVTGDSMQPVLYEDDTIIIHKQNDVESGQIAIILIDNEEATVKKVIKHENHIELIAFNSYYPPRNLDKNTKFTILGKVIEGRIKKIFE